MNFQFQEWCMDCPRFNRRFCMSLPPQCFDGYEPWPNNLKGVHDRVVHYRDKKGKCKDINYPPEGIKTDHYCLA